MLRRLACLALAELHRDEPRVCEEALNDGRVCDAIILALQVLFLFFFCKLVH